MFSKEYRMLSFVPRWGIAPRITTQSVAEHCFYVALYASQIAQALDLTVPLQLEIVNWALRHDAPEVWTSDMPGPGKRYILDEAKLADYIQKFGKRVPDFAQAQTDSVLVAKVIKTADLVDEILYLGFEEHMGNALVMSVRMFAVKRLTEHVQWFKQNNFGDEIGRRILHSIADEYSRIGVEGATIPAMEEL